MTDHKSEIYIIKKSNSNSQAITICTIISVIKDICMSKIIGNGILMSAWLLGTRIALCIKHIIGEENFKQTLMPIFYKIINQKNKTKQLEFGIFITILLFIISIVAIIIIMICFLLKKYNIYIDKPIIYLSLNIIPIVLIAGILSGISNTFKGILNIKGYFFVPSLTASLYNIAMITTLCLYSTKQITYILTIFMAKSLIIAGILQISIMLYLLKKCNMTPKFTIKFFSVLTIFKKKFLTISILGTIGSIIYYISKYNFIAILGKNHVMPSLYFCGKLANIPKTIIGIAISSVCIISMIKSANNKNYNELFVTFKYSLKIIYYLIIPFIVLYTIFKLEIVTALYGGGKFNTQAIYEVTQIMPISALKMFFDCSLIIIIPVFFTLNKALTNIIVSSLCLILNIFLSLILIFPLQQIGIMISSTLQTILHFYILFYILKIKYKKYYHNDNTIFISICKSLISSIISISIIWFLYYKMTNYINNTILLILNIFLFFLLYFCVNYYIKSAEQKNIIQRIKQKFTKVI